MRSLKESLRYLSLVLLVGLSVSMVGCSSKEESTPIETAAAEETQEATDSATDDATDDAETTEEPAATESTEQAVETEDLTFDSVVLKVGNEEVTYREVLIYLLQLKNKYEPSLGTDIWDYEVSEGTTFGSQAKDELLEQITEIKIIKQQAVELGMELGTDEVAEVTTSTKAYLSEITQEDQKKYGITEEIVQKVLEENYLAQKVYDYATNEVDTDISDDEAKQIKVQVIQVMTEGEDKDGNVIDMTDEEKEEAKEKAEKLRKQAVKADDFSSFASENTDANYVDLTFGKGDYEELEETAFSMSEGDISKVIETSTGYFILKLISDYDEDATNERKEEIIEEERNKVFQEKYKIWSGDYKVTKDTTKCDALSFNI